MIINRRYPLGRQDQAWSRPFRLNKRSSLSIGLIGFWPSAGSRFYTNFRDYSGRNNHLTNNTAGYPSWVSKGYGEFPSFDGTTHNHRLVIPLPVMTVTDNFTLVCRFEPDEITTFRRLVFFIGNGSSNGYGIASSGDTAGRVGGLYGGVAWLTTTTSYTLGQRVTVVMRRLNTDTSFFLDGTDLGFSSASTPLAPTTATSIGSGYTSNNAHQGLVEFAAAYNRPLSNEEIAKISDTPTFYAELFEPIPHTFPISLSFLPINSALAFGEQSPLAGETPVSWATWSDGAAGSPTISGDADWGKLELAVSEEGRSAVYDFGDSQSRVYTLTENEYGTGQGTATLQIRGDTTTFAQDDGTPSWETYSVPITRSWRYIQVRENKTA